MTNILRSIALLLVFGFFGTQAYGQACAGQTAPDSTGVTPEELTLITDTDPDGSEEVTFRYPSNDEFRLDIGQLSGGLLSGDVVADQFNESLQFDADAITVLTDAVPPQPAQGAVVEVVNDNSPGNSTWTIPASDSSDYIGCVTLEYSATDDGAYNANLRPLLDGFLVFTDIPDLSGLPIPISLPFEVGDTIQYDALDDSLATLENPLNGDPVLDSTQIANIVDQVIRPTPGSMQPRFVKNEASSNRPDLAAAYNMSIFPNPVNNASVISYTLNETTDMSITMTDATGRVVSHIFSGQQTAGQHEQALCADCGNLPAGVYFVHVVAGQQNFASRVVVR